MGTRRGPQGGPVPIRTKRRGHADFHQPGRCRHRHRFQASAQPRRHPHPGGLRPVPGPEEPARTELGTPGHRAARHRRGGAHPCPSGSLRLPAAADDRRLPRQCLHHPRQPRSGPADPARQRLDPGEGRRVRQSQGLFQAQAGAAAVPGHRCRAQPGAVRRRAPAPGNRLAWGRPAAAAPRRPHPRCGDRPDRLRRPPRGVLRRPGTVRRPGDARSGSGARGRRGGDRIHLRQPAARPLRPGGRAGPGDRTHGQARRHRGDPGIRRRPRPGPDPRLVEAAPGRTPGQRSGLPGQPDGHQRHRVAAPPPPRPQAGSRGL